MRARHLHPRGPARAIADGQPHVAKPAHADPGDQQPGLDAAGARDAGIDRGDAALVAASTATRSARRLAQAASSGAASG
jgi:hypothetical protein